MTNSRRLTLRLSRELKEQLTQEADKVGMTLNSLIIMKILNSPKERGPNNEPNQS